MGDQGQGTKGMSGEFVVLAQRTSPTLSDAEKNDFTLSLTRNFGVSTQEGSRLWNAIKGKSTPQEIFKMPIGENPVDALKKIDGGVSDSVFSQVMLFYTCR